jgi:hypothetical protein
MENKERMMRWVIVGIRNLKETKGNFSLFVLFLPGYIDLFVLSCRNGKTNCFFSHTYPSADNSLPYSDNLVSYFEAS